MKVNKTSIKQVHVSRSETVTIFSYKNYVYCLIRIRKTLYNYNKDFHCQGTCPGPKKYLANVSRTKQASCFNFFAFFLTPD